MQFKIEIDKANNKTWSEAFDKNIEALKWAIDNAPIIHLSPLMDTHFMMIELRGAA